MVNDPEPERFTVGIGALCVYKGCAEMTAYAIGSCIALCLYDPGTQVGALAHIMLPSKHTADKTNTHYADHAIKLAKEKMEELGANSENIVAALVGGAKMFSFGYIETLNIGEMNIQSVREELRKNNIKIAYEELGGKKSRTVHFRIPGKEFSSQIIIGRPTTA